MAGSVNNVNPSLDATVRIFDEFYNFELNVPVAEYDAVNSYFESALKDKTAARNFTTALFRVSRQSNTPVLVLLDEIQKQPEVQLTAVLAYYFNSYRSKTTLLGVGGVNFSNYYVARNVLL